MSNKQDQISALLVERAGYVARGLIKRVASVDEALAQLEYKITKVEEATLQPETSNTKKPANNKRNR